MKQKVRRFLKEPNQRQLRIGEEIRHLLSLQLSRKETHIKELDLSTIMISEVSVSADLTNAKVFVMTLLASDRENVVSKLNLNSYIFQNSIASKVNFRRMPKLVFEEDKTFDQAEKINRISIENSKRIDEQ